MYSIWLFMTSVVRPSPYRRAGDVLPAQVAQCLDYQPTDLSRSCHIAGSRVLQDDLALANLDSPRATIRKINDLHGDLRREPKQIGCVGPGGLKPGGVTTCKCACDIIRRWLQPTQRGINFRVVVQSPSQLADKATVPMPHQCKIDSPAGTKIRKTIGRKDPAPFAALYPAEDLAVGTVCMLAHIFERKVRIFFFQK